MKQNVNVQLRICALHFRNTGSFKAQGRTRAPVSATFLSSVVIWSKYKSRLFVLVDITWESGSIRFQVSTTLFQLGALSHFFFNDTELRTLREHNAWPSYYVGVCSNTLHTSRAANIDQQTRWTAVSVSLLCIHCFSAPPEWRCHGLLELLFIWLLQLSLIFCEITSSAQQFNRVRTLQVPRWNCTPPHAAMLRYSGGDPRKCVLQFLMAGSKRHKRALTFHL